MVNKNYCFLNFIYAKIKKYDKIIYVDILYIGSGSMDQKRIGNLIKELRKKNNLTQEQLVEKLKAQDYPATLISSSQRYRVSIESFPTENEANAARDEYRKITDRQDIWVHKVN